MTIGAGAGSRSNSRSSRSAKLSTSKLRSSQQGSGAADGASALGGQPLSGAGAGAGKSDIKHRFEITKKLGSGTYGKVSLAYDHKTEREVAVKLIKKSAIENKQDLVRIRREIRIMSALKHPNIIQIFEVFENKDKIILVMEYASGGELYDYVSTYGSLPEPEARRIFRQITSAVLYCHKHKVAHRDLKLENILLDADNNAKIADFGLSNYFSDKNLLSTFCGSPLYASPEIINGTPYKGPEVDCWSLGILLYTLVYGSMPFDGRDFNRMVRQIKRGAYFEPDTPSTASMLIRNMLRVNPERRADIDEIASHWWLNLEENMPVIQELPENQILDHTPLTERAETMIVQDLADETDVFMDFGHLSATTRKKIEEFRRRRKEAEEYNENSPIKPPKTRKTEGLDERRELTSLEKSLRHDYVPKKEEPRPTFEELKNRFTDPLERLKQLESRLQNGTKENRYPDRNISALPATAPPNKEMHRFKPPLSNETQPFSRASEKKPLEISAARAPKDERMSPEQPEDPTTSNSRVSQQASAATSTVESRRPSFVPLDSEIPSVKPGSRRPSITQQTNTWRLETDSLNMLMNQVLEQMETGPVSMNLVARIKSHPFYDSRPMVKELLESIIAAQPPSVQKEASKIIQQQSQDLIRRQQSGNTTKRPEKEASGISAVTGFRSEVSSVTRPSVKYQLQEIPQRPISRPQQRAALEERPWHSVEVGFDPDEENDQMEISTHQSIRTNATEETVPDTSFEDETDDDAAMEQNKVPTIKPIIAESVVVKATITLPKETIEEAMDEEQEGRESDEEEAYNTEIDELGNEVDQVEEDEDNASYASAVSQQGSEHPSENNPPPDPQTQGSAPQFLDTFDRGLAKRQSKGKYQHNKVELYGRGVSTECESPTLPHRRIGGPQPTIERSPFLFDKAKKYIMTYPKQIEESEDDIPGKVGKQQAAERKMNWLKTQDPDMLGSSTENPSQSATPTASRVGSVPPRSPPPVNKSDDEAASESSEEESEEEESDEEEEEEDEVERDTYASTVGHSDTGSIRSTNLTFPPVKEPTALKNSSPAKNEPKQYTTVAELKLAEKKSEKSQNAVVSLNSGGNVAATKSALERKIAEHEPRKPFQYSAEVERILSKSPTPPVNNNTESTDVTGSGIQAWETAASYIRRKNRERRQRNRTIGTPEDVLRSAIEYRDYHLSPQHGNDFGIGGPRIGSPTSSRALSPTSALVGRGAALDPFYSHSKPTSTIATTAKESTSSALTSGTPGSLFSYVRPRYHDESYRKRDSENEPPTSPARFNAATNQNVYLSRDDRAKSKSAHDLSPDRPDNTSTSNVGTSTNSKFSSALPSYTPRYENESSALQSWAQEPRRFHVYQTRAEREAERNTAVNNLHPSSTYRTTGSAWYTGATSERPVSSYAPGSYRSRFDDNFSYRRSAYDVERPTTPAADNTPSALPSTAPAAQPSLDHSSGGIFSRFRPVTRRVASALTEADRRNNVRSQSMDRKASRTEESDYHANLRNRLMTPELNAEKSDYSYVNYHDTSSARGSLPREPDHSRVPSRGILKNKQSADLEPRATATGVPTSENGRGLVGGKDQSSATSGVKNMLDRLKRHLSMEKSVSPAPSVASSAATAQPRASSVGLRHRFASATGPGTSPVASLGPSVANAPTHAAVVNNLDEGRQQPPSKVEDQRAKKRSFLSLGRRRTTEMRLNPEGKIVTAGFDEDFKRPSSPIEKIKSLFRKTKEPSPSPAAPPPSASAFTHHDYGGYSPSGSLAVASGRYGLTDKVFGVYPSSNLSPSAAREPYTPQYRKYTAGANGGSSINYNRYSYTPSGSDRPLRHWYEDSHLY